MDTMLRAIGPIVLLPKNCKYVGGQCDEFYLHAILLQEIHFEKRNAEAKADIFL